VVVMWMGHKQTHDYGFDIWANMRM